MKFTLEELQETGARGDAFCHRLHSVGYAVVSLDEATAAEVSLLRRASAAFFAQPASTKCRVTGDGRGVGGEGIGYRDAPEKSSEFVETFLTLGGGTAHPPSLGAHPELAERAAAVHQRLAAAACALLTLCVAHVSLPPEAAFDALAMYEGPPTHVPPRGAAPLPPAEGDTSQSPAECAPEGSEEVGGAGTLRSVDDAKGGAAAVSRTLVSSTLLRICHYRAAAAEPGEGDEATAATEPDVLFQPHTDSTLLTLSPLCATSPGLQLQAGRGAWLDVEAGASVARLDVEVHAGDFLGILSRGYFFALRHRVVRPVGGRARVACPLLLRPRDEWRRSRGWLRYTEDESDTSSSASDEGDKDQTESGPTLVPAPSAAVSAPMPAETPVSPPSIEQLWPHALT